MLPDDRIRLKHMADAIDAATTFIEGRNRADLDEARMLRFALVRAVEIVGEGAANVSSITRAEFPDVPWPSIIGMRNRFIHAYLDVDLDIL